MSTKDGIGLRRDACQELSSSLLTGEIGSQLRRSGIGKIWLRLTIGVLLEV